MGSLAPMESSLLVSHHSEETVFTKANCVMKLELKHWEHNKRNLTNAALPPLLCSTGLFCKVQKFTNCPFHRDLFPSL